MRILLCADSYPPQINGVAGTISSLAGALAERGHCVLVYTVSGGGRAAPGALASSIAIPIAVTRVPALKVPINPDFSLAVPGRWRLLRLLRRFRPDVVHCHSPFTLGWQGLRAARTFGIPCVGTHHTLFGDYIPAYFKLGADANRRLARLARRYVAAFYTRCDVTTCASRFLADDLLAGGLRHPPLLVPNPVDIRQFRPRPRPADDTDDTEDAGTVRLIVVGRLAPEKNLRRLLALAAPALRRHPAATLDLVGDGPSRGALLAEARRLGLERQIGCTGFLRGETLARRIASGDLALSASLTENQPLALLESLASGVPVVALAGGGIPEIITDGANGFLVDPDDASGLFSRRVTQLIEDGALRRAMARRARASALPFATEACRDAMLRVYARALARADHDGESEDEGEAARPPVGSGAGHG